MRKESWSIGIACFIGTALGLLIAWKLAEMFAVGRYLWFVGAFLGAIAAYLLYDPVSVWSAMRRAWRELADVEHAKLLLSKALFAGEIIGLLAVIVAGVVSTFFGGFIGHFQMQLWGAEWAGLWFIGMLVSSLITLFSGMIFLSGEEGRKKEPSPVSFREDFRIFALFVNPIGLPLVLAAGSLYFFWKLACGIAWLAWRTPKAAWSLAVFLARFIWRVFVFVHSKERRVAKPTQKPPPFPKFGEWRFFLSFF